MKIVACFLSLYACFAAGELIFHVSPIKGKEDDYIRLKRRQPSIRHPREEKLRMKENVCVAILGSEFFDSHNVELVNPNHKSIYKHVKQNHPKIHEEHFKVGPSSNELIKPKFANPYRLRDVPVNGNIIREYMFACITRNAKTKSIEQYFISPEYNWFANTARFVFGYNNKNEMIAIAVAEKNAGKGNEHANTSEKIDVKMTNTEKMDVKETTTTSEASTEQTTLEDSSSYEDDPEESESW